MDISVLHILDHSLPVHSGYSFRSRAILREQRRMSIVTHHVTGPKQGSPADSLDPVGDLSFYRTRAGRWSRVPIVGQWDVVRQLERRIGEVIVETRPTLLHAHSPVLNGWAALRAGRRFGLPVVYEVRAFWEDAAVDHGTTAEGSVRYRASRALETYVLRAARHVTCICEGLRADIVARGIPADRVTVIPNAVDLDQFGWIDRRDEPLASRLGLTGRTVLGFVGSFYDYEGLDLLVEALPLVLRRFPDARLLLVGGGPQERALRARIERAGIGDRIVLTGRVPHDEVGRHYSVIDVLCYPRRAMRLTELVTPLKPLEAMAQGRLVLASDVGGHRELIRDGRTGFLFGAGSVEALASGVERVFDARAQWPEILRAGRRYVEDERNWTVSVARYRAVYGRALAAPA